MIVSMGTSQRKRGLQKEKKACEEKEEKSEYKWGLERNRTLDHVYQYSVYLLTLSKVAGYDDGYD